MFETFYHLSLDCRTPIICTTAYVLYSVRTNRKLKNTIPAPRNIFSFLTCIMVLHNILLCVFSILTFINTLPILVDFCKNNSLHIIIVDPHKELQQKLQFWMWIFYVSKIYEIVDSLILHWNKKQTSFLQMYHHAGAIVCCWMLAACQSHLAWIFVVLNSFIHSLMYFYYLLMTVKVKIPKILKKTITRMQILQFIAGASLLTLHVLYGQARDKNYEMRMLQYTALCSNMAYVTILFVLFKNFEKRAYKAEQKEKVL